MPFVRAIGRWSMTGLIVGNVVGASIFGVTGELTRLVGRPSPLAMLLAALGMAVIVACIAEVASQFCDAGGVYLYVHASFGRLAGLLVGWFWLLSLIGAPAACANLFVASFIGDANEESESIIAEIGKVKRLGRLPMIGCR